MAYVDTGKIRSKININNIHGQVNILNYSSCLIKTQNFRNIQIHQSYSYNEEINSSQAYKTCWTLDNGIQVYDGHRDKIHGGKICAVCQQLK
jgi:endonuclease I